MNREHRTIVEFLGAVDRLQTGPDGFPLRDQGLELDVLARKALAVTQALLAADSERTPAERSLLDLADATCRLAEAANNPNHDPTVAQRWFQARARLVDIWTWP